MRTDRELLGTVAIALLAAGYISSVSAEPKRLVCQSAMTEEYLSELPTFYEGQCKKYGNSIGDNCKRAQEARDQAQACRLSGLRWSHEKEFLFDSESLKGANVDGESFNKTCWGETTDVVRTSVSSTPATIIFTGESLSVFSIDRKTLMGGYGGKRDWKCSLKTVDTGGNKI